MANSTIEEFLSDLGVLIQKHFPATLSNDGKAAVQAAAAKVATADKADTPADGGEEVETYTGRTWTLTKLKKEALSRGYDKSVVNGADKETLQESLREFDKMQADGDEDADDDADDEDEDEAEEDEADDEEDEDEDDDEAEEEEAEEEEGDEEEESEWSRDDFKGMSLAEVKAVAKDEPWNFTTADMRGIRKVADLLDKMFPAEDEEADEDEDDEADEEAAEWTEEALMELPIAKLREVAEENWGVDASKMKTKAKIIAAIYGE